MRVADVKSLVVALQKVFVAKGVRAGLVFGIVVCTLAALFQAFDLAAQVCPLFWGFCLFAVICLGSMVKMFYRLVPLRVKK
jgi:uncharacterized membrane protein YczE